MIRGWNPIKSWRPAPAPLWGGALLLLLVVLAYWPATRCGFIWDDDDHVTANPCIVGPLGLRDIWTSKEARICPLVQTTFWFEYQLWGRNPLPYHVVNVLMHAAAVTVLWRVLLILKVRGAWLGAALWALHPVQVESVAWITEMKNTQSGLFYLLGILFYCKSELAEQEGGERSRARIDYGLALLFGALAMASKSSTVVLPLVLGLCAWWIGGRSCRVNLIKLAPLLVMSVLAGMLSIWTQKFEGAGSGPEWALDGLQRVALSGRVVWFYLVKLIWPHPLIFIYPRWELSAASASAFLPVIGVVVMSVVLWRNRTQWNGRVRAVFFAWSYFLLALLPVLGLLNHYFMRYSFVGDHFQYLASIGPLALAGAGIWTGLDALKKLHRWHQSLLCALLLLVLGILTWRQCAVYQSRDTLWRTTLAQNPSCWMAHYNLGNLFMREGQLDEALAHFQRAIEVDPRCAEAHNNIGNVLQQKGRLDEALAQFQEALEYSPGFDVAHNNLGFLLLQKGKIDEAMAHFQKALATNRRYAEAHNNLGNALQEKGQVEEALAHYRQALGINPDYSEAHNNLGLALQKRGELNEAIAHYQKALEINPGVAAVHKNLGNVLQRERRLEEAATHYQKAIEINSDDAESLNNLAYLLATSNHARLRDGARAVELAQRASRLTGGSNPIILGTLAAAQAEAGNFPGAMETAQQAIRLAETQGNSGVGRLLQEHLKLYQQAQPLRGRE